MKNKFFCILKVFFGNMFEDIFGPFIKIGIKGTLKAFGLAFSIAFLFSAFFFLVLYFRDISAMIFTWLAIFAFFIFILYLIYKLFQKIINDIYQKWENAKNECFDILGDDK